MGEIHTISLSTGQSTGTAKNVFDVLSSTVAAFKLSHLAIWKTTIGSSEGCVVRVFTGSTIISAGGSTLTVSRIDGRTTSTSSVSGLVNSSTPGSSGTSARQLYCGALNDDTPFIWTPQHNDGIDERPVFGKPSALQERLQVDLGASGGAGTFGYSATVVIEEIGKLAN